ncbi:MAG: AMP-binding protein [Parvibaculaceae bacterium]
MPTMSSARAEFKTDVGQALAAMLAHAAAHSPFYRELAWAKSVRGGATIALKNIPVTRKSQLRDQTERFFCPDVPPSEGRVKTKLTSGSTGEPMAVRVTERSSRINSLEDERLCRGWGFEGHASVALVKNPSTENLPGTMVETLHKTGFLRVLYTADSREAFDLVRKAGATLLYTRPHMALGILEHAAEAGVKLPLQLISTISEVIPDQLRSMVGELPGCRMVDKYGSEETGIIAVQCSSCGAYHPTERQMIVEILDEGDRPVRPGKTGRVVVTPLFNRAMPLVRYEIGDYAVVARAPTCIHASLSLAQICGRERNLFKMPDGRRIFPGLDPKPFLDLGLRHFRLLQRSLTDIELQYVPKDPAFELPQERGQELIDKYMVRGFRISCRKLSELPRARSGKFLMHESLV